MIPDPDERQRLFARIAQYSVREAEAYAARLREREEPRDPNRNTPGGRPRRSADPHLQELEQQLIDSLGTKVTVTGNPQRGKIEISFFTADDLDRIAQVLRGGA